MVVAAAAIPVASEDAAEFEARLQPLYGDAVRLAYGMLRNSALAEEAAQEAALRAWRSRGNLHCGTELRPWFLAIVANCCRDVWRSSWWRMGTVALPECLADSRAAATGGDREQVDDLRAALRRLGHRDRLVIVLRFYLDLPHQEIAAITGQSEGAVRARVCRALRRLRLELAEEEL